MHTFNFSYYKEVWILTPKSQTNIKMANKPFLEWHKWLKWIWIQICKFARSGHNGIVLSTPFQSESSSNINPWSGIKIRFHPICIKSIESSPLISLFFSLFSPFSSSFSFIFLGKLTLLLWIYQYHWHLECTHQKHI